MSQKLKYWMKDQVVKNVKENYLIMEIFKKWAEDSLGLYYHIQLVLGQVSPIPKIKIDVW